MFVFALFNLQGTSARHLSGELDYLGDSRTVDVHVKRLREKLEGVSKKWLLKTVWGVGSLLLTLSGERVSNA